MTTTIHSKYRQDLRHAGSLTVTQQRSFWIDFLVEDFLSESYPLLDPETEWENRSMVDDSFKSLHPSASRYESHPCLTRTPNTKAILCLATHFFLSMNKYIGFFSFIYIYVYIRPTDDLSSSRCSSRANFRSRKYQLRISSRSPKEFFFFFRYYII